MNKIFKADTLDEAYKQVSQTIDTPISKLEIEVLQTNTKGLLGLLKKQAILKVTLPEDKSDNQKEDKEYIKNNDNQTLAQDDMIDEIKAKLKKLFDSYCCDVDVVLVKLEGENSVYVKLDGQDAKIIIGTKGFRYDALSFMLHGWLKKCYNKTIKLEVLDYLKNKELYTQELLEGFFEKVDEFGRASTKPFSSRHLRVAVGVIKKRYPDKNLIFEAINERQKIITIDDQSDEI